MSRSGYQEDCGNDWQQIMWRGAVTSAFRGRRGQAFMREMLVALDALPVKRLVKNNLEENGEVCALGAVGKARGLDMNEIDPEDCESVANEFDMSRAMACEIMYENDDGEAYWREETPEQRFERMRRWVESKLITEVCGD